MECEDCGTTENVSDYIDPYTEALSDDHVEVVCMFCADCYEDRWMSI